MQIKPFNLGSKPLPNPLATPHMYVFQLGLAKMVSLRFWEHFDIFDLSLVYLCRTALKIVINT